MTCVDIVTPPIVSTFLCSNRDVEKMTAVGHGIINPIISAVTEEDKNLFYFIKKLTCSFPFAKNFFESDLKDHPIGFATTSVIRQWLVDNQNLFFACTHLDLSSSEMKILPKDIADYFKNLKELNLSSNARINFTVIEKLKTLQILNLSRNGYQDQDLPTFLENGGINKINLEDNDLATLPKFVNNRLEVAHLKRNPFGLNETGKEWEGERTRVQDECFRLCLFTLPVHVIGSLFNVAYRIVRLMSASHFWLPLFRSQPFSFKASVGESCLDLLRIVATPFSLIALQATALYGFFTNPYKGVILYTKIERFAYEQELVGKNWVNYLAMGTYLVAYNGLRLYCIKKSGGLYP